MRFSTPAKLFAVAIFLFLGPSSTAWGQISTQSQAGASPRERLRMDFGWRFSLGHVSDLAKDFDYFGGNPYGDAKTGDLAGPPHLRFDDSGWEVVDVPHDWGVTVGYDPEGDSSHGYRKIGRKYPANSIGWYRKTFEIGEDDLGKRVSLEFDGVFRNCRVFLNGHPDRFGAWSG